MSNLNLKQACLLDVSGELSGEARQALFEEISTNPAASEQYETTRQAFSVFDFLPIPEPSALERKLIPAQIKEAIHAALVRPVKQARRVWMLIRYAVIAALLGVTAVVAWGIWASDQAENRRHFDQIARITAATDRVPPAGQKASAYELAVTDVEASIRQLETESPTLSSVYDKSMANLLDALASVPQVYGSGDFAGNEWSADESN